MRPKIPTDAFEQYVALGAGRTYQGLADHLGISKRTVVRHALADRWQERLAQVERDGRAKADARLTETVAAVTERHLRTLRAVQHKALQALTGAPMGTAAQAAATLIAAVRAERAIVAPNDGKAAQGMTWAELLHESYRVPPERVEEVRRELNAAHPSPPPPTPPQPARTTPTPSPRSVGAN